ncbi:hypothetical protein LAJ19_16785 (plasmid) [Deinococcus taeanensis]|uniref:hypothetical protein n=1 Tax=Deinococcus taeanensis TaxID=2737050 RepID=UPI001CDCA6C6|nr:hypothetical protein [Deinococcus taeanensis]UBV44444.1 hypothetical protein LAJ19_16785 [Deinococcus taeanensis]
MGRPPAIIQKIRTELALSEAEKAPLRELYEYDGAWTDKELKAKCPRQGAILKAGLLLPVHTVIGPLHMLSVTGRRLVLRDASSTHIAPQRNLDRAYIRLCMEDYGFEQTDERTTRGLEQYAGKMELFERLTPQGVALVGGTMSGGGVTRTTIDRTITRLKSSALAHHFRVILFTPSPTRGRGLAQKHASMFTLLHHVPGGTGERLKRTAFRPTFDDAYAGPASTALLEDLVVRKHPDLFPEQTLEVLRERRADRIDRFRTDLETDRVISAEQLYRHYMLHPDDLKNVPYVEAIMHPVHSRAGLEVRTRFYLTSAALQYQDDNVLGHYAGVGEMRRVMNVPANESFKLDTRRRLARDTPDAIFHSLYGPIAFEYDTGVYKLRTVQSKLESFAQQGYLQTIWGTANRQRIAKVEGIMQAEPGAKGQVILSEWWRGMPTP